MRQPDGARETLVTLRVIVLEADLEFDGLEEVALLRFVTVLEEFFDVGAHSGDCDFRHDDSLPREMLKYSFGEACALVVFLEREEEEEEGVRRSNMLRWCGTGIFREISLTHFTSKAYLAEDAPSGHRESREFVRLLELSLAAFGLLEVRKSAETMRIS